MQCSDRRTAFADGRSDLERSGPIHALSMVAPGHPVGMAQLKVSLILKSGARIGPGKAALLESVRDTGSISAAARAMGMDYKRAWMLIDSLNRAFDIAMVERATGGSGGGGATLTPFGAEVLVRYRRLEAAALKVGAADLKALERHALPDPGPKV